jgi:hypothetical protein
MCRPPARSSPGRRHHARSAPRRRVRERVGVDPQRAPPVDRGRTYRRDGRRGQRAFLPARLPAGPAGDRRAPRCPGRRRRGGLRWLAVVVVSDGHEGIGPGGGTSASTPLWAGIAALADQDAHRQLGFLNQGLYRIAQSKLYHRAFHDITHGNNTLTLPSGKNISGDRTRSGGTRSPRTSRPATAGAVAGLRRRGGGPTRIARQHHACRSGQHQHHWA